MKVIIGKNKLGMETGRVDIEHNGILYRIRESFGALEINASEGYLLVKPQYANQVEIYNSEDITTNRRVNEKR